MIKDHGLSIRAKLLNISKTEKIEYMKVLGRYFHERLLYRLSISQYKSNFMLKGSSLLYAHYQFAARPTVDIDLLGLHIDRDQRNIVMLFKEILSISCKEDGVTFDIETIQSQPIAVEKKYPGINLSFVAHLHTIVYKVSIDIGFGDVVTPHPVQINYPLLVKDVPSVNVYSYSLETLIAEKFQAMIERDIDNSRMKDFMICIICFVHRILIMKFSKWQSAIPLQTGIPPIASTSICLTRTLPTMQTGICAGWLSLKSFELRRMLHSLW